MRMPDGFAHCGEVLPAANRSAPRLTIERQSQQPAALNVVGVAFEKLSRLFLGRDETPQFDQQFGQSLVQAMLLLGRRHAQRLIVVFNRSRLSRPSLGGAVERLGQQNLTSASPGFSFKY